MNEIKLGLICFANDSGLGYQTKRLAELLRPYRLLVIDSNGFSKNKVQHWEWYDGFTGYRVHGFPSNHEVRVFLEGLTHVLCVENPLNYQLTAFARNRSIKVYIQTNYEFCDFLDKPNLVRPYKFLMPSFWKIKEMEGLFGRENVTYLPPPINHQEFQEAREANLSRSGTRRFLHVAGTLAVHDRNGTLDVLAALEHTKSDFELVITSQHELPQEYMISDRRVKYRIGGINQPEDLFVDFDAMILPRRYGGLCLPMCEALMSGIPVIMPNISPNWELLPKEWLVEAQKVGEFMTRTMIDIHQTNIFQLAEKIDWLANLDQKKLDEEKMKAFDLGYNNFSHSAVREDYNRLWT